MKLGAESDVRNHQSPSPSEGRTTKFGQWCIASFSREGFWQLLLTPNQWFRGTAWSVSQPVHPNCCGEQDNRNLRMTQEVKQALEEVEKASLLLVSQAQRSSYAETWMPGIELQKVLYILRQEKVS